MRVEQVGPYLWRIPPDAAPGVRVPGLVVADEPLMRQIRTDAALAQLANGATLPGIVRAALAMPDIHQGYGLAVGGVVATDVRSGVVSPGAIGFDINCGVRLLRTGLEASAVAPRVSALVEALYATVPTGVGGRGSVSLDARELGRVMADGAGWAVGRGHGTREDLEAIESAGAIPGADPEAVSRQASERAVRRLLVHRKGATRSFPGQPVIVPGDMGRYSFVLVGTEAAMRETFGSTCHGAGRVMSRTAAVKAARGRRIVDELAQRGVVARAAGFQSLAEEMPEAYKDVREVVDVVHRFGISTRVARLKPIGVIKG